LNSEKEATEKLNSKIERFNHDRSVFFSNLEKERRRERKELHRSQQAEEDCEAMIEQLRAEAIELKKSVVVSRREATQVAVNVLSAEVHALFSEMQNWTVTSCRNAKFGTTLDPRKQYFS